MTRKDVEEAVAWVLGKDALTVLQAAAIPLPKILDLTACKVFREDWARDGKLDQIREAMQMLQDPGHFTFENDE